MTPGASIVVIGVGNRFRRDDGVGLVVAEALRKRIRSARVVTTDGNPATLMTLWSGADTVFVVDAVSAGRPPGSVVRWEPATDSLPRAEPSGSTHALGLGEAIELARSLGELPPYMLVYGVQVATLDYGEGLSDAVAAAAAEVAAEIADRVESMESKID